MKIAVVTGASSGIGREFVLALDKQQDFDEIWVIARTREKLEALASETKSKIRAVPLDLQKRESIYEYEELLKENNPEIAVLVNASGFGFFGPFMERPLSEQLDIIDLNDRALVGLTYVSVPFMKPGSQIYNMGSLSSFQPVPCINVYGASKAFVLSFSRALNVELKDRGIRVMAVCPGWVKTDFFNRAVTDDTVSYYNRFYTPQQVVKRALKDMKKKKDVSICGLPVRNQVRMVKILPHKLVMKVWCKQQKLDK